MYWESISRGVVVSGRWDTVHPEEAEHGLPSVMEMWWGQPETVPQAFGGGYLHKLFSGRGSRPDKAQVRWNFIHTALPDQHS